MNEQQLKSLEELRDAVENLSTAALSDVSLTEEQAQALSEDMDRLSAATKELEEFLLGRNNDE